MHGDDMNESASRLICILVAEGEQGIECMRRDGNGRQFEGEGVGRRGHEDAMKYHGHHEDQV